MKSHHAPSAVLSFFCGSKKYFPGISFSKSSHKGKNKGAFTLTASRFASVQAFISFIAAMETGR